MTFTLEQLDSFISEHLAQKQDNPGDFAEVMNSCENPVEAYAFGLFEGLINGIVMAGGIVEGLDAPLDESTPNKIVS